MFPQGFCSAGFILLGLFAVTRSLGPEVETTHGRIRGSVTDGGNVFRGVPYAMAPVGLLRWEPPQALPSWRHEGVKDTVDDPPACPQVNCERANPPLVCPTKTSEDCLFLTIYTPLGVGNGSDLPVMAYLHGGNFFYMDGNSPLFDGGMLTQRGNVIQVNINYRLGALGFLVTGSGDYDAQGNFGLQDQLMALAWIRDNIRGFGGDPTKVTLFGQSAGAQSALVHLTSEQSAPLFRAAILESTPIALPYKTFTEAFVLGGLFAQKLGCPVTDIKCMRSKTAEEVAKASYMSRSSVASLKILEMFEPYGPYIDGKLVKGQPLDVITRGNFTTKPVMIGTTTEETVLYVYGAFNKTVHVQEYLALVAGLNPQSAPRILEQYPPSLYPSDQREVLVKLSTDLIFACSTRNLSRTLLAQGLNNAWLYVWDHALSFKGWGPLTWCEGRVCHGSEIAFVFDSAHLANFSVSPEEEILSGDVIAYWTNFAWSGNPNYSTPPKPEDLSSRASAPQRKLRLREDNKWPAYSKSSNWTALRFKTPASELVQNYKGDDCGFWDTISYSALH
ncbi:hypothetical protein EGW08_006135 [Elysia chlorotica]|uniref:Carboxylic ester hydrolase n=1 Tax=Elysia chlorotica TaxID=188477 RepID=A0A3S1A9J4_ELYCH|nr:hypothetical protein EGW08_006135 [Elysia chlorotica]